MRVRMEPKTQRWTAPQSEPLQAEEENSHAGMEVEKMSLTQSEGFDEGASSGLPRKSPGVQYASLTLPGSNCSNFIVPRMNR